jgi:hypothetical protein
MASGDELTFARTMPYQANESINPHESSVFRLVSGFPPKSKI